MIASPNGLAPVLRNKARWRLRPKWEKRSETNTPATKASNESTSITKPFLAPLIPHQIKGTKMIRSKKFIEGIGIGFINFRRLSG